MKTIAQLWEAFDAHVDPAAPPIQHNEMRIAFFAGFKSMLDVTLELAERNEVEAILRLEQYHMEMRRFGAALEKQRKGERR